MISSHHGPRRSAPAAAWDCLSCCSCWTIARAGLRSAPHSVKLNPQETPGQDQSLPGHARQRRQGSARAHAIGVAGHGGWRLNSAADLQARSPMDC